MAHNANTRGLLMKLSLFLLLNAIRCNQYSNNCAFSVLVPVVFGYTNNNVHVNLRGPIGRIPMSRLAAATVDPSPATALPLSPTPTSTLPGLLTTSADDPFELISGLAATCLYSSDVQRNAVGKPGGTQASSETNWINDESSFVLKSAMDRITLKSVEERTGLLDRDEASTWIRWMRSTPTPILVDLTHDFRELASGTAGGSSSGSSEPALLTDELLNIIHITRSEFLNRLSCRLILLPSGASLNAPLLEPTAAVVYGKLLYGGVTRYSSIGSSNSNRPPRQVGEQTEIKATLQDNPPAWMQYGGSNRMYEAVDMGPAALLEVLLLPTGTEAPTVGETIDGNMAISRITWKPQSMFRFLQKDNEQTKNNKKYSDVLDELLLGGNIPMTMSGKQRNEAFTSDFETSVGGLGPQIESIVRRVLDGRIIRPADDDDNNINTNIPPVTSISGADPTSADLSIAAMEAEELVLLGLAPVRGLLLYGPPGCGKTALAREISRSLRARSPKIVSAPELLDRWVGGSEKLVRSLFVDAEAELAACNGDATKSALHVIVIDEIDAVFRKRSSGEDSGEATRSSAVNQILAKMDGVDAIPNVLLVGMTNRRELLDEALLRPGRLEVQIEIPLPDKIGRREILQIHFDALRKKGRLSKPLCCAIDGVPRYTGETIVKKELEDAGAADDDEETLPLVVVEDVSTRVTGRKRRAIKRFVNKLGDSMPGNPTYDLASDGAMRGFSGADIAGLVRCAGSIALSRARRDGGGVEGLLITLDDVKEALVEIKG